MTNDKIVEWLRSERAEGIKEEARLTAEINQLNSRRTQIRQLIESYSQILEVKATEGKATLPQGNPQHNGDRSHRPTITTQIHEPSSLTKNDLTIWVLGQHHSLSIADLQKKVKAFNDSFQPKHVYTVLWKLKNHGLVDKSDNEKYYLTPSGRGQLPRITEEMSREIMN